MLEMIVGDLYDLKDKSIVIVEYPQGFAILAGIQGTLYEGIRDELDSILGQIGNKTGTELEYQKLFGIPTNRKSAFINAINEIQIDSWDVMLYKSTLAEKDPTDSAMDEVSELKHRYMVCRSAYLGLPEVELKRYFSNQLESYHEQANENKDLSAIDYVLTFMSRKLDQRYQDAYQRMKVSVERCEELSENGIDAGQLKEYMITQTRSYIRRLNLEGNPDRIESGLEKYAQRIEDFYMKHVIDSGEKGI